LKHIVRRYRYWLILVVVILNACTGVAVKEPVAGGKAAYEARAVEISAIHDWSLVAKISLDDGDDGGSGKLQWDVSGDSANLDFHGAMGRGAWHLRIDSDAAVLSEASGETQTANSVNDLIQRRIGWPLPVDALQWWVRGLAAPGAVDEEQFDSSGLLTHLEQFGWSIKINRYKTFAGLDLPVRLDARRDEFRVKLAIGRWHIGSEAR